MNRTVEDIVLPHADGQAIDVERVRGDFPILERRVDGRQLVYLDNAATTQKPWAVINAVSDYYTRYNANVHRGVHRLSVEATDAYEGARAKVARFLGGVSPEEIVFTRGTSESINLVAQSFLRPRLKPGDEILISHMEHHSNIVPWQLLREQTGAVLKVVPIDDLGSFRFDEYERLLSERTRLVAVTHISNALGTINPILGITVAAHRRGVPVLVDGAQATPHIPLDLARLGCDFFAFSGHKVFAPTGTGVLWGKRALLDAMPPYQGGGEMIRSVTFDKTTFNDVPHKFEAGTPNIAGVVGLGAAIDYLEAVGMPKIAAYEQYLLNYATTQLQQIPGLRIVGNALEKASVLSFVIDGIHPHDIGTILDHEGIAIRTGHHCAQPVMDRFGVPATARASLAFYNTRAEIDALASAVRTVTEVFG